MTDADGRFTQQQVPQREIAITVISGRYRLEQVTRVVTGTGTVDLGTIAVEKR